MRDDLIKALEDTLARPTCEFLRIDRGAAAELLALLKPPTREDAQPVASAYRVRPEMNDPEEWTLMHPERAFDYLDRPGWETQPLYTHPAPDALRVAVEALERIATVDMGGGFLGAQACRQVATKALSDMKANQKGGA